MAIFDYVVIGLLVLALVFGLIKGFSGMFFGFFSVLLALGAAVALTMPVAGLLGGAETSLSDSICEKMTAGDEDTLFTYEIYKKQDTETGEYGLYMIVPDGEGGKQPVTFATALDKVGGDGFAATVVGLLSNPIENAILTKTDVGEGQENATSFAAYVSKIAGSVLLKVIVFVAIFIVAIILLRVLNALSDKLTEMKFFNAVDKILGVLICLVVVGGIILGLAAVAYTYLDPSSSIVSVLNDSKIIGFVKDHGVLEKLIGAAASIRPAPSAPAEEAVEEAVDTIVYSLSLKP